MNNDAHKIYETYKSHSANKEVLEEGILDRLKARTAGAVGAVKGAGQQVAGTVKGAVAGAKGDVAGVQAAQQQKQLGGVQGQISKLESYRATAQKKIKKASDEIFNDISKLGIDLKRISPNSINVFTANLDKAFESLISSVKAGATQQPTSTQPPPQPQAANQPQQQQQQGGNLPPAPGTP